MSHSKNDFPIMGGTGRQVTKPYRESYDAFYKLINPNTKKPYTNAELAAELEHRQQEYSVLAQLITPDLEEIQKKARLGIERQKLYSEWLDRFGGEAKLKKLPGKELKSDEEGIVI